MIQVKQLPLGELETNCYILWDDSDDRAVIVDPAASGDYIVQQVLDLQLEPTAIWLTHGHFDHVLGLLEVATAFDLPIWMHAADNALLSRAASSAAHWLNITPDPIPPATDAWEEQDQVWVGSHVFEVMHLPGHTPGSVGLYSAENELLISGDTLFKDAIGRTDFGYSSKPAIRKSLHKLGKLPEKTLVLPGHGETTYIANESRFVKPLI
jgi:glyoxylase-like metal-dependent hydrolase (beta-lactamase superfamily II)